MMLGSYRQSLKSNGLFTLVGYLFKMTDNINIAIPSSVSIDGFKNVLINECNEPLVTLTETNKLKIANSYFKNQYSFSLSTCYIREGLAERLRTVAFELPENYSLLVYDGWRPYLLQLEIFKRMYKSIKARNPHLSAAEIEIEAAKYASKGSLNPLRPSLHFTGGAVDITLSDNLRQELHLGTPFDATIKESATRYFERQRERGRILNAADQRALKNRRILYHAMIKNGFTNYPNEWWHYDYGNQLWGKINNKQAIYGLIEP
jgi:D-alanyl-D-alanine dipeptidase